jgi:hypothetical protein
VIKATLTYKELQELWESEGYAPENEAELAQLYREEEKTEIQEENQMHVSVFTFIGQYKAYESSFARFGISGETFFDVL